MPFTHSLTVNVIFFHLPFTCRFVVVNLNQSFDFSFSLAVCQCLQLTLLHRFENVGRFNLLVCAEAALVMALSLSVILHLRDKETNGHVFCLFVC